MSILDNFNRKFRAEELELFCVGSWRVSVRPIQPTVGSLILSLSRECTSLADMSGQEGADFTLACKKIEETLGKTFAPDKINYLALMMVDPQVHFHVIPRYSKTVSVSGQSFSDRAWPGPPDVSARLDVEDEVVRQLLMNFRT